MDLQRKIQQLRNDGDDEFADAIEGMISRAEVADALAELLKCFSSARDLHSAAANDKDYQGEEETSARLSAAAVSWQDAINYLDTTIAKLGLTAEAFDAAIASRPDALEKLAGEALGEKSKTNACFDCGSGDVADTCPECQKAFCENCVEADEGCCEKEETI